MQRLGITEQEAIDQIRVLLYRNHRHKSSAAEDAVKRNEDGLMFRYHIRNKTVTCNDGSRPALVVNHFVILTFILNTLNTNMVF